MREEKRGIVVSKKRAGFTLVELLVVIAIIAILAAILFPLFVRMQRAASQSQCLSNLGEVSKGMMMYASDHERKLPRWKDLDGVTWDTYVFKYVRNGRVFTCPINCVDANKRPYPGGSLVRSYAMPKNITGMPYDQAPKMAMTVMLFEKGAQLFGKTSDAVAEWYTQTFGYAQDSPDKFWHGRGKAFVFCDGHAKYFAYAAGPFSYNFPSFTAWSRQASSVASLGGAGYCGWCDNVGAGGDQFYTTTTNLPGANIPR